jgi:hypothetical protein
MTFFVSSCYLSRLIQDYPDQEEEVDDSGHDSDQGTSSGTDGEVEDPLVTTSRIENIKVTQASIEEIQDATLDNGNRDDDVLERLHNPPEEPTVIFDPDTQLSLDLYLAVTNSSEYKACREAVQRCYPGSKVLSYYSTKKLAAENPKGKGRAVPILHADHMTDGVLNESPIMPTIPVDITSRPSSSFTPSSLHLATPTALSQASGTTQPALSLPPATGSTVVVSESTQPVMSSLPLVATPAVSVFIRPPSTALSSESAQPASFSSPAAITHVVPPSIARNLKRDKPMVASPTLLSARYVIVSLLSCLLTSHWLETFLLLST